MDINRNNYEEFFLMYVDNELSAESKTLVDEFVRQNPDLQEELHMLQQSIVVPDNIVFNEKESLYKNQFDTSGLQEKLLLHLDNELSPAEAELFTVRIDGDTGLKQEWDILQQTKLLPDNAIVFAGKEALYRKENGRIVSFPWMKLAVAAVFLGFIVWGGIAYVNNKTESGVDKGNRLTAGRDTKPVKLPVEAIADTVKAIKDAVMKQEIVVASKTASSASALKRIKPAEKTIEKLNVKPAEQPMVQNTPTNNLPQPLLNNLNKEESNKTVIASVPPVMKADNSDNPGNRVIEKVRSTEPENSFATTASLTESSEENHDRIFFMDEEKVKKTKLGGFLRKASRVFARNANIKPGGNKIKVANLEFAIQ